MSSPETYRRHRFPIEVVEHRVGLYFRFALSYRNVEEMMAERGVQPTYETVQTWCHKLGTLYAARLGKKRPKIGSNWHLDEVFIRINGVQHYLWRAVDQHGATIDILVQPKRDRWAVLRFFSKLLHTAGREPRLIVPDKLRSYAAAKRCILPGIKHRQSRYLNNRAENSHEPTGVREQQQKRFRSPEQAQRFLSLFESLTAPFRLRHLRTLAPAAAQERASPVAHDCSQGRWSVTKASSPTPASSLPLS